MPQGWGDTDSTHITVSDAQVGTKLANSLTKKTPYKGPGADSEEKHEPASDIYTVAVVESLKVLDPKWPIREEPTSHHVRHTYLSFSEASDWTFAIASAQPVDAVDLFSSRQVAMRPSPGFIFPHTPLTSALQAIKPSFRASAAA
jgi:hypothetical protein